MVITVNKRVHLTRLYDAILAAFPALRSSMDVRGNPDINGYATWAEFSLTEGGDEAGVRTIINNHDPDAQPTAPPDTVLPDALRAKVMDDASAWTVTDAKRLFRYLLRRTGL